MTHAPITRMPRWTWIAPLLAVVFYAIAAAFGFAAHLAPGAAGIALAVLLFPALFGAIFSAVYHAEVIAHRAGEPYGTLILTAAVTIIEVALIASVMISGDANAATLARDTVYAVVMTVCTGLSGLCILVGGLRYREPSFRVSGVGIYLTVLIVLATLTLILPNFTEQAPGPLYAPVQLAFVAVVTLLLYGAFLYIQTVRHRDYFVTPAAAHAVDFVPSRWRLTMSGGLLVVALVVVVLLSKKFAVVVELGRLAVGAPPQVTGLIVAILILLPEAIAAVAAARNDALQTSLNLALGSALATIGMTFPAAAIVSLYLGMPLVLGLEPAGMVLLALTMLVSTITFATGRAHVLHGLVHLVIFATFLFLAFQP
ncbi:MAG: calcium:proton antiporter [Acidibrevibacterium sp.]|uniref:calcium:proton antiporter n=1 Tax=Acidibrevibacterium sp. TaxID=2606776 RepID=UPI003D01519A